MLELNLHTIIQLLINTNEYECTVQHIQDYHIAPVEYFPVGHSLDWQAWRTLNILRTGVGRSKDNLKK